MIAKVTRGASGAGLVRYLMGGGKANEHEGQRVIAVAPGIDVELGEALTAGQVADLGYQLDTPQLISGVEVPDGHVWHLSLTNPAADRVLSDGEWAEIVAETVDRLGFSAAPGRAQCPWVAVRHGLSERGNDHVHLAVSLAREDGTTASIWQDRVKLSRACSDFERRYGLSVVEGRAAGRTAAPAARVESVLAFRVREAADQSRSEAEFVKRLRSSGVLVHPRYAKGSTTEVTGYSVALPPARRGERAIWQGGGRLGRDLRLPALRERWGQAPEQQAEAARAWDRPVAVSRAQAKSRSAAGRLAVAVRAGERVRRSVDERASALIEGDDEGRERDPGE